ncbi:S49 family peptidase [Desulfovibrio inopinatus]|uniref:S49 family peptidase n=1 Tax=Desulfovibrio inopinatus TaxID=102109 RepID=UPI000401CB8D|nr:S49 family peptidase [Desulfovibrio inopinatus]
MTLHNILGRPWAMEEAAFHAFVRHVQGAGMLTIKPRETVIERVGGAAVIGIAGPLDKTASACAQGYDDIGRAVAMAADDPDVTHIVLRINSPGGSCLGLSEVSSRIAAAREKKPVFAFAEGLMCSAAYWIGSAAQDVGCMADSMVGSIGTVLIHAEYAGMLEEAGITPTVFSAGKHKADGNPYEHLSDASRKTLQTFVDGANAMFVAAVARNRNFTPGHVETVTDGRIHYGADAVALGLADVVVEHCEDYLNRLEAMMSVSLMQSGGPVAGVPSTPTPAAGAQHPQHQQTPAGAGGVLETPPAAGPFVSAAVREGFFNNLSAVADLTFGQGAGACLSARLALGGDAAQLQAAGMGLWSGVQAVTPAEPAQAAQSQGVPTASADEIFRANMLAALEKAGAKPSAPVSGTDADAEDASARATVQSMIAGFGRRIPEGK